MFRRLSHTLPKDAVFPADIESLGYFINEDDLIRQIRHPNREYQFTVSKNDRVNEVYKDTMNECVRRVVHERLRGLGFEVLRLPLGAEAREPHVPIWVSPNIATKKRVIIIFGERNQDPGIFSYRVIGEEGINVGSCLDLIKSLYHKVAASNEDEVPGVIIANPSQLYWYRGGCRAVTAQQWQALPRASAVDLPMRVDEIKNRVPGNANYRQHVIYVFKEILPVILNKQAKLDLIGLEWSGTAILEHLASNWSTWSSRISGICLGGALHKAQDLEESQHAPKSFLTFLSKRCRAYFVSPEPLLSIMEGREQFGCNCFSGGEELYQENVIVKSWRSMVEWFDLIHSSPDYEEPELQFVEREKVPDAGQGWAEESNANEIKVDAN